MEADEAHLAKSNDDPPSDLCIEEVRIQDFRALDNVSLLLGRMTVLIGENNSGKTSILRALGIAVGSLHASEDDLRRSPDGSLAARALIDVKITPAEGNEFNDEITGRLGTAIQGIAEGKTFVALRTIIERNVDGSGIQTQRTFLKNWSRSRQYPEDNKLGTPAVSGRMRKLISFQLLAASRDIVEDLRSRSSNWSRLLANLDIAEALRLEIEQQLNKLGQEIIAASPILKNVREELENVRRALAAGVSEVSVAPLPARLSEVARGVDVLAAAPGTTALPMRMQGMGARSLASMLVFRAFSRYRLGRDLDLPPLAVTAFEEPEAHLHPQAQRAVLALLRELPGQALISTHSPLLASASDIFDLRLFRQKGGEVVVSQLESDPASGLSELSLKRNCKNLFKQGYDALFAKLVTLFEGDSERDALLVFAEAFWDPSGASGRGISMVAVGGAQTYPALVTVLEQFGIPWLIFSDGDGAGQQGVKKIKKLLGTALDLPDPRIVMLPVEGDGQDFEAYIAGNKKYRQIAKRAIENTYGKDALDSIRNLHGQEYGKNKPQRDYKSEGWKERLVRDFLRKKKATWGRPVAEAMIEELDEHSRPLIPEKIRQLFERAQQILGDRS